MSEWDNEDDELERQDEEEEARRIEEEHQAAAEEAQGYMNTCSELSDDIQCLLNGVREQIDSVQQGFDTINNCLESYPESAEGRFVVLFDCACGRLKYDQNQLIQYFNSIVDEYQSKLQNINDSYGSWSEQYYSNC